VPALRTEITEIVTGLGATGAAAAIAGHVEIRWSHGRFAQPPEAKV
jgi:hypothetical protein